jgi:hypothetical protein
MAVCEACGSSALVQWCRRASEAECAAIPAEQGGPSADAIMAVYACGSHAISAELASLVHGAGCSGPASSALPNCDCTPEPAAEPVSEPATPDLPPGW